MSLVRGHQVEAWVAMYLMERGLNLIAKNVRSRFGELDLVMKEGATCVFVEVRSRRTAAFGTAAATVTMAKQRRLILAAQIFLSRYVPTPPCRFDVFAVDGMPPTQRFQWIKAAFTV